MSEQKLQIRIAEAADAAHLLAIYAPYVEHTAISFEYETPSEEEFRNRIEKTLRSYPYLVGEAKGTIVGYAYASAFKERKAYQWAVETSIYLKEGEHAKGYGRQLYEALEAYLKMQNVLNLNACIVYPHPESVAFHERLGYRLIGHFTKCGYKFGKWYDMIWMEKMLGEHLENHPDFIGFPDLPTFPAPDF